MWKDNWDWIWSRNVSMIFFFFLNFFFFFLFGWCDGGGEYKKEELHWGIHFYEVDKFCLDRLRLMHWGEIYEEDMHNYQILLTCIYIIICVWHSKGECLCFDLILFIYLFILLWELKHISASIRHKIVTSFLMIFLIGFN